MNISLITETYPPEINGVAMTWGRLVDGLIGLGHRVTVVRPQQDSDDHSVHTGRLTEQVVPGLPLPGYEGLHFGLPAPGRLRRSWVRERPDIVHVATEGPLGVSAIDAAERLGIPLSSSFHTNFHVYSNHYGFGPLQAATLAYLKWVHNRTGATLGPSDDLNQLLIAAGFANVGILSRGVDTTLFRPDRRDPALRAEWGVDDDEPVIVYVGRIAAEKNIPLTVRAWLAMRTIRPDLKLVLVGDGPLRESLARTHPEIIFAGMRRGEDLARHYASGDLFLFASISETFGNVVTEAMASGLPVLAFRYAAPAKYIRSGENGITVPFEDEEAYLAAATRLAGSTDSWKSLGSAARKTTEGISWNAVVKRLEEVFHTVRARHRSEIR